MANQPSKADQEAASRLGYDVRTIRAYRKQGAPVDDPGAMAKWLLASKTRVPAAAMEKLKDFAGITDLGQAKIAKLIVDCERAQLKLDIERRNYVPIADVRRDMLRIGSAMRAEMTRLKGEAPNWHDRSAVEIERMVATFADQMCRNLNDEFNALYGADH